MTSEENVFELDEQANLAKTQAIRLKLIASLTEGDSIPKDLEAQAHLLAVLDSTDKQVATKAKLRISAKANANSTDMAALVATMLNNQISPAKEVIVIDVTKPINYELTNVVPGEKDLGRVALTFEDLVG